MQISLFRSGDEVYVLNRGNHPCPKGAKNLIADRNEKRQVKEALSLIKFDIVIDGSAYTNQQTQIAIDVLNKDIKHYIHISSAAVYEDRKEQPYKEQSKRGTSKSWGKYSTDKYMCEETLFEEWNKNKLPITIVRPFYIYGPGNNLDRETYVFSRLLQNKPTVVPGKGKCKLHFGYIDDICDAIMKISKNRKSIGQAYNLSGKDIVTFEEWIKMCAKIANVQPNLVLVNARDTGFTAREWFPFREIDMIGDCTKIKEELGIELEHSLYEGLEKTFNYYNREELKNTSKINDVELDILKNINQI